MQRKSTPLDRAVEANCDALGVLREMETEVSRTYRSLKRAEAHVRMANQQLSNTTEAA